MSDWPRRSLLVSGYIHINKSCLESIVPLELIKIIEKFYQMSKVHKYQENCIYIEGLLPITEQIKLWQHVIELSSKYKETQARNGKSNFRKIIHISCKAKKWKDKV